MSSRDVLRTLQMDPANIAVSEKFVPPLAEDEAVSKARLIKALADPTRLRILSALSRYEGAIAVFELVECFTLEQATISHHLRILSDAGLVHCMKRGLWAYYYLHRDMLEQARGIIAELMEA